MKYFAHTIDDKPEIEWHKLASHLTETANLAASFAHSPYYADIFRLAGYMHDLGKYQLSFQKYLREGGRRGSVPHASWGAGYSLFSSNVNVNIIGEPHEGKPHVQFCEGHYSSQNYVK